MTVHITSAELDGETVIRVDGWLESEGEAAELVRVVGLSNGQVVLDLKELQTANEVGIETLRALAEQGVRLSRVSDYIKLLLGTIGETLEIASTEIGGSV